MSVIAAEQAGVRSCPEWVELEAALTEAGAAMARVMQAMAAAGAADLPVGTPELTWLTQTATRLARQGERVRVRSHGVLTAAQHASGVTHDDAAQFAARKNAADAGSTRRDAHLAEALGNLAPGPSPAPAGEEPARTGPVQRPLATAMDAGLVDSVHARIALQELDALPEELPEAQRWRAEQVLVEKAQKLSPRRFRVAARRVLAELGYAVDAVDAHQNDQVAQQEQRARDQASFWMTDNGDGTVHGRFTLPVLQGRMLAKVLSAMTAPRRLARKRDQHESALPWADQQIDWAHEKGLAFAELIDHLPTDHLSTKTNAIVIVTTDYETLRGQTDRVGLTDHGDEVSAAQVRRLAATAGLIPAVMGSQSQMLDLGRQTRTFTEVQRTALSLRYTECAAEYCDRPLDWCEIHHDQPWAPRRGAPPRDGTSPLGASPESAAPPGSGSPPTGAAGGRTDLANAIPLCSRHHHQLDDARWSHTTTRDDTGLATVHFTRVRR
ncbi:DUF222 domain-containing protein [Kytococcus aerolatus]|uniref:DUF222 domain-containing protein n=1 Tax=Kytococcus aerolatus TaxID=592308 RepID=UPI001F44C5C4|nr:DUF222 domain-containing protein [Kytococcus aerolatus]